MLKVIRIIRKYVPSWYQEETIKQIKQWAISRKPKKAKFENSTEFPVSAYRNGYNIALADYVKNLKEE